MCHTASKWHDNLPRYSKVLICPDFYLLFLKSPPHKVQTCDLSSNKKIYLLKTFLFSVDFCSHSDWSDYFHSDEHHLESQLQVFRYFFLFICSPPKQLHFCLHLWISHCRRQLSQTVALSRPRAPWLCKSHCTLYCTQQCTLYFTLDCRLHVSVKSTPGQ